MLRKVRVLVVLVVLVGLVTRRAVLLVILLAAVFAAVQLLPGDAASSERGEDAATLAVRRHALGLDRPLPQRFCSWLSGLATGDLGRSAHGQRVSSILGAVLPNTLLLGSIALATALCGALLLGGWAAMWPGGCLDRCVSVFSTAVIAVPEFVLGVGLLLVMSLWTGWLPAVTVTARDGRPASWDMLLLPLLALALPQLGWNTRMVRGALADQASLPHVHAAVLDGLSPCRLLLCHVLPGALPAIAAAAATSSGTLLGGAVVVETLFNYPGVGSVLSAAISDRDTPVVAGTVAAVGTVISLLLLLADCLRDRMAAGA